MFTDFIFEVKNWLFGESEHVDGLTEFERIESKHTRVHHDHDIYETIRVH